MNPWLDDGDACLYLGDCREVLRSLPAESAQTCVTSPPYFGLRDYGHEGQIGLEATPDEFVVALVETFREVRRVLKDDGTLWLNLGDSYASNISGGLQGSTLTKGGRQTSHNRVRSQTAARGAGIKHKDLMGIPWMVAFALRADGWYLRSDVIWAKPNPMPESVTDRPTRSHEYLFLLSKSARYFYNADAVREADAGTDHTRNAIGPEPSLEPSNGLRAAHSGIRTLEGRNGAGRNRRSVWSVATQPYPGAHFATFPPKLIEPCILAGYPEGGTVLDPFSGSGTTAWVARHHGRQAVGIDLSEDYLKLAAHRLRQLSLIGAAS